MRRWLLILLVMLLPLRGWSAEHMAMQMTQGSLSVAVSGEQVATMAMPADCPMLSQPASETEPSSSPSKSHVGCQTCQLCMSLTAQNFSSPGVQACEQQAPPASIAGSFISADLARQVKPPILWS